MNKVTCKKTSYSSEKFANIDIKRFKFIDNNRIKPIRAYLCNKCNTWHITSKIDYEKTILSLSIENTSLRITIYNLQNKIKDLIWFKKWNLLNLKYHELLDKTGKKNKYKQLLKIHHESLNKNN